MTQCHPPRGRGAKLPQEMIASISTKLQGALGQSPTVGLQRHLLPVLCRELPLPTKLRVQRLTRSCGHSTSAQSSQSIMLYLSKVASTKEPVTVS